MTDDELKRFKVIQGGPSGDGKAKPRSYRARKRGEPEPLVCHLCNSSTSMEVKTGRMLVDGKVRDGTKQLVCVHCLSLGKVTMLV